MAAVPVISSLTLTGLPRLLRQELGNKAVVQIAKRSGIDLDLIQGQHCFLPQAAVVVLIDTAARVAGEANFGLLLAPHMSARNYGVWGQYVLAESTLGGAIERCISALGYHSSGDLMSLRVAGDTARFSYRLALAGHDRYPQSAGVVAGDLWGLCQMYLPADWLPVQIELDCARPRSTAPYEDLFRCPVLFGAPAVTVVIRRHHLAACPAPVRAGPVLTLEDVARDIPAAPQDVLSVISEQIRRQILSGSVSIDLVARAMDTSIRSLQRELSREGTDFRSMTNALRVARARELLRGTEASITNIAADIGYSSLSNFTRAFRKSSGISPRQFRALR